MRQVINQSYMLHLLCLQPKSPEKTEEEAYNMAAMVCSLQNKDDCLMCGS